MWALLGPFLASVAGPLVRRILAALGFGIITYVGFQAVKDQVQDAITSALTGMPLAVYQILALGGFVDSIGIWLGALTAAVAAMAIKKLGLL
jgi:hypothetical protein